MMKKHDAKKLTNMKRSYDNALKVGDRLQQARCANVIGDIYMNAKRDYDEALKWFQIDYNLCADRFSEKELLPTCQSLGEVYHRLGRFSDAIIYQKKHLVIAKNIDDRAEQQKACTQLGLTYQEMFRKSKHDQSSLRKAREYLTAALKLADQLVKANRNSSKQAFVREYVDAHNNIGMLQVDRDRLEEAETFLTKGLQICEEKKVDGDDDSRARLHYSLSYIYIELRKWKEARQHIEKHNEICRNTCHRQGQAKGFINLGELHYSLQDYDTAALSYQKAMEFVDGEQSLADKIEQNLVTVKDATKVMDDMKKEEENLKNLTSNGERKRLKLQKASLDRLIEQASTIRSWKQHHRFARKKKNVAEKLLDSAIIADSYLVLGLSYQNLRKFTKAIKWFFESFKKYRAIHDVKGEASAILNLGNALDSIGKWNHALYAFDVTYRMAREANLPHVQLSALENMHFSQLIRFEDIEEAMKLQSQIDELKQSISELGSSEVESVYCSETDTDGEDSSSQLDMEV